MGDTATDMQHHSQDITSGASNAILAIDTSTGQAGLALGLPDRTLTRSWAAGRTQTTSILPAIDEMLREAGLTPGDLTGVAVAAGPGTFTGLRVGLSVAKGIVLARGIPLVGIPTLQIAASGIDDAEDLVAVLPAGRGRVVWQRFTSGAPNEARNTTLDELVAWLVQHPDTVLTGEIEEGQHERVASHQHLRLAYRDPAIMIRIARKRLATGQVDDPVTLEPVYLHGVVVQSGPVQDRLRRKGS